MHGDIYIKTYIFYSLDTYMCGLDLYMFILMCTCENLKYLCILMFIFVNLICICTSWCKFAYLDVLAHSEKHTLAQIKEKWRTLFDKYKAVTDNKNKTGRDPKTFEFYDDIDEFLSGSDKVNPRFFKETKVQTKANGPRRRIRITRPVVRSRILIQQRKV